MLIKLNAHDNVLHTIARNVLKNHSNSLPDLQHIAVILPNPESGLALYHALLDELPGNKPQALIPPWTGTLSEWLIQNTSSSSTPVMSHDQRRLLFLESLNQHPDLFKDENKWQVTDALLKLFDEMTLARVALPESNDDWLNLIQNAYAADQLSSGLRHEAGIVHTLWHAWHKQLQDENRCDSIQDYLTKLAQMPEQTYFSHIHIALDVPTCPSEQAAFEKLITQHQCTQYFLNSNDDSSPNSNSTASSEYLLQVFNYTEQPLLERAKIFAKKHNGCPLPLSIYYATSFSDEVSAIDKQIRLWLSKGKNQIAVVSEDRKLSRRLRALLERSNINIQDISGWSLATTSASSVIERWLECVEEDFNYRPLLDLLKSKFFDHEDRAHHLNTVYRLENDIVHHENISCSLSRYKNQIDNRLHKLTHWPETTYNTLIQLLDKLEQCACNLVALYNDDKNHPLSEYITALLESLGSLELLDPMERDDAGQMIISTLKEMLESTETCNPHMHWRDFRTWLGINLEEQLFIPVKTQSPVQLMTLDQYSFKQFDAVIIASLEPRFYPGKSDASPFFNQSVRQQLGLPFWQEQRTQRLQNFQRCLLSAEQVLLTCQSEDDGDPIPLSPWVEALAIFTECAFDTPLKNTELNQYADIDHSLIKKDTDTLTPPKQPKPVYPDLNLPFTFSASSHQRLINCPYSFFLADLLGLGVSDEIREILQKSDYGEKIHFILRAFHEQVKGYPKPFSRKINAANKTEATEHLRELSKNAFSQHIEDNMIHNSWLQRWLKIIPAYIDWLENNQQTREFLAAEVKKEVELTDRINIKGRLDRIDQESGKHCIIDYKTSSAPPKQSNVDEGEDVQLTTYALLDDKAHSVEYLSLDSNKKVSVSASLNEEQLYDLRDRTEQRLVEMVEMLRNQAELPAWGDEATCDYCQFDGICRKDSWK